ncbi:TPA: replication/maintenance protein RepL [Campylobacter jejuni]|nr:replication/maintenance protein RepL [Campylobacter jejuni]
MTKVSEVDLIDETRIKVDDSPRKSSGIKTTYVGHRTFVDRDTGEVIELEYVEKKVSHTLPKGWKRVYLENFMEILTGLYSSGKKLDIIEFILENLNSENQLTLTQAQVMKKLGVSSKTIVETYKYLVDMDFMKKKGSVFVVNPKYVCAFGSDKKNRTIAINYSYDEPSLFD